MTRKPNVSSRWTRVFHLGITFLAAITVVVGADSFTVPGANVLAQTRANFTIPVKDASISPEATFTNSAPITINDASPASPYPSSINVSGISGTIPATAGSVRVTLNGFSHTFPDDIGIVLVGPTGAALLLQDGCGEGEVSNVTYTLSDTGATQLPDVDVWTAGTYKPASYFENDSFPAPGPGSTYGNPGPAGGNTATFSSVFAGTAPNGTWSLFVVDFVAGDTGLISGGWTLTISGGTLTPAAHQESDFDGDGKTDAAVARNTGGGSGGQLTWYYRRSSTGTMGGGPWGISTDIVAPGDYDGDNKSDIAVWRPGAAGVAAYYVFYSATSTAGIFQFGQTGDNPDVHADFDGDGKADIAVYRAGAAAGQQSFFYYRGTLNNPSGNITYIPWGLNGDFPFTGDLNGDGKADVVVQRNNGGGQARFFIRYSTGATDSVVFGTPTDFIVPGDYDGDGKTDIAVVRGSGGNINWYVRPSSTGAVSAAPYAVFGSSATDFLCQGDYDGDGKTDVAVWRPSADPTQNFFYFLGSNSGFGAIEWGQTADIPVANWNFH